MFHLVDNLQDKSGNALAGYYVKLKVPGGAYATLYADESSTPIVSVSGFADTAVTDANGRYDIYVEDGTYDLEFFDKSDINQRILTVSAVPLLATTFVQSGTGAVSRTLEAKGRDSLSVLDFIPVAEHAAIRAGTTTTNVTSYIVAAMTAAQSVTNAEKRLVFPSGTYRVSQLALRDYNLFTMHAEGTVQIVGIDGSQGWIIGDDRFDDLGHTEDFTTNFRMTGGPWLIGPLSGQTYARGLKLQNFTDSVFENVSVSGTYTPTGGTGNRIAVELELSFNNAFYNMTVGYPGAPIGADKSYGLFMGTDNVNANRFYGYRGVGNFSTVAATVGVRVEGASNCFFGGDISAIHTAFEDNAARACHRYGMYHEDVSRVLAVTFASRGCIIEPGYVSIAANGTAYDLSGAQAIRYTIRGGNHSFNASGTTGLNKGTTTCFGLTYEPGIDTGGYPATAVTGTDLGSGGSDAFKGHELSTSKLTFPDTANPSTNTTTLDDYRETAPSLGISVGATAQTVTRSVNVTKVGNTVAVKGTVTMAAAVSGTGDLTITGLPYTATDTPAAALSVHNVSFTGQYSGRVSGTTITLHQTSEAGTRTALTQANLTATSTFDLCVSYTTAA